MTAILVPRCHLCGNAMHALQYTALIIRHPSDTTSVQSSRAGVCLVCPRCDSIDATAS